jgi:hypothetical protein
MPRECGICLKRTSNVRNHVIKKIYMCGICRDLPENRMITYTVAKIDYKLRDDDFNDIVCGITRNPHTIGDTMRLYLLSDIKNKRELKDNELEIKNKKKIQDKLDTLIKYKAPVKSKLNSQLYETITADYLDLNYAKPKKGIRQTIRELHIGEEMYKYNIPQNNNLIYYFLMYFDKKDNSIKKSINTYDVKYPYNIISYSLDISDKKTNVFNIFNGLISSYLSKSEIINWCDTYKTELFSFNLLNNSSSKIKERIKLELKRVLNLSDEYINNLLEDTYKNNLERTYNYSMHPLYGTDATIDKIIKLEKLKVEPLFEVNRRKILQDEFDKWDKFDDNWDDEWSEIEIHEDDCDDFIKGNTLAEPDEIASVISLTSWLLSYSHVSWSNMHENLEIRLKGLVLEKSYSWRDAYNKIINNKNIIRSACGRWKYRYW